MKNAMAGARFFALSLILAIVSALWPIIAFVSSVNISAQFSHGISFDEKNHTNN